MALVKRISRLFAADMHAVLDQLEEPAAVLKQAIREMEEELARQTRHGKSLAKDIDRTAARIEALEQTGGELDGKLDTCFEHGNEALARKLIRRKLETRNLAARLGERRAALAEQHAELEATIAGNRDRLDNLRQKAELVAADGPATETIGLDDEPLRGVGDDEVEIAFLREKQARAGS